MKKTLITACIIAASAVIIAAQNTPLTLSVAPFNENTLHVEGQGAALSLRTAGVLKSVSGFALKNTAELKEFLALIERVQLGLENFPAGERMKKVAEADYVVVGSVSAFDAGRQVEADTRIVLPDDGRILFAAGGSGDSAASAGDLIESLIRKNADAAKVRGREKNVPDDAALGLKERLTVAVGVFADRTPESRRNGLAGPFSDILNAALAGFDSITAIDRINTEKLAAEKELTMVDVTYLSPAVRSREFSARDVEYIVSGEIFSYSGLTAISYKVETASSGEVVFSGQTEIATSKGLRPAAYMIARSIEDGLVKTSGFLRVTSEPNGAAVTVDGEMRGTTPVQISLGKGSHAVSVSQDAFDTMETNAVIVPRQTVTVSAKLKAVDMDLLSKADAEEARESWVKAIGIYDELIKRYPKTDAALTARYRAGWIYQFKLAKPDAAKEYYSSLLSMYPGEYIRTEAYYGLASIYEAKGDKAGAQKLFAMLIREYPQSVAAEEAKKKIQ